LSEFMVSVENKSIKKALPDNKGWARLIPIPETEREDSEILLVLYYNFTFAFSSSFHIPDSTRGDLNRKQRM